MYDDHSHALTLNQLLENIVAERGDATAVIYEDRALSFSALAAQARSVAAGLAALGVGAGDKVAVWLPNMPEWLVLEFALARLGAVAVAINTQFRRQEVEDILQRAAVRLLVLSPAFKGVDYLSIVDRLDPASCKTLEALVLMGDVDTGIGQSIHGRSIHAYASLTNHAAHEADHGRCDSACNIFTSSGTTSAPKLVVHQQSAVTHHALAIAARFGYREDKTAVILGMLPFCGVFGFDTIMGALAAGRPVVLLPAFDAAAAVDAIKRYRVTHASGSDEMFRRIFEAAEPASRVASFKEGAFANFSTDARTLVDTAQSFGIKLFQTFGSSEVQALMSYPPNGSRPERWALGGGTPTSDATRVRVRETETGELLPAGQPGELEIAGPNVMIEYMNNPEANAESVTGDGFVRTGDLGYIEDTSSFVYLARLGDTLRLGGYLVNPREIESYLERFGAIEQAQVVAVDTPRGPRPVASVIMRNGDGFDESDIIEQCKASMARFKVPIRIVGVDAFPITSSANGEKIQKTRLREQAQALVDEKNSH